MNAQITLQIIEEDSGIDLRLQIPDGTPDCIAQTLGKQLLEIGLGMLNEATGQNAKIQQTTSH